MFPPIETYLERIFATLENVVAPEIESDYARVQLFAAIGLLQSLGKKVEYRRELVGERIQLYSELVAETCRAIIEKGGEPPEELQVFVRELRAPGSGNDLLDLERLEKALSQTIDFFFANRGRLPAPQAADLDKKIREALSKISLGDLSFLASDNIDKAKARRPAEKGGKDGSP